MARYFMELAYNGTNYCGWQRQPNGTSVQQVLENALTTILRTNTDVTGAGRTDAGVHASYYVAHFNYNGVLDDCNYLCNKINRFLPVDIVIFNISRVEDDVHSRFSAVSRRYEYHVTIAKNPFLQGLATRLRFTPDFDLMNEAASVLKDYTDFTSFSKLHGNNKTNLCKIDFAYWEKFDNRFVFNIQADRFLRNMVRAIVGTLFDVGRKKISLDDFRQTIESKDRGKAGTSAPAEGLYLVGVTYPETMFKSGLS